jgi:hypothetical protein
MTRPDPAVALPRISASTDRAWLEGFRDRMLASGHDDFVTAITERLNALDEIEFQSRIARPMTEMTLAERVWEAIRVHEELLRKKNGKRTAAARSRAMIRKLGEKGAVIQTVVTQDSSTTLALLAKYDRLDCVYEQIILDFPQEFEPHVVEKARQNLARLETAAHRGTAADPDPGK